MKRNPGIGMKCWTNEEKNTKLDEGLRRLTNESYDIRKMVL